MARPVRVEFAEAAYHVMARGNERKAIFRDDQDRQRFVATLTEMVERFGIRLHAYCLMPNHYHLLLQTPRGNLSRAVGWLQVTYTVRFNRRHRRSGHLFQGRFKAQLIEADEYAQGLVEYVHLNPVRPRRKGVTIAPERASELDAYRWSSHRVYAGLERRVPPWLSQDWLRYWGAKPVAARRQYRRSLGRWFAGERENPWTNLVGGLVLGGDKLLEKINGHLGRKANVTEQRWRQERKLPALRARVTAAVGTEADERLKIWARVRLGGERGVDVAADYGYRTGSGVGQVVRRLEQQSTTDRQMREKMARIKASLSRVES